MTREEAVLRVREIAIEVEPTVPEAWLMGVAIAATVSTGFDRSEVEHIIKVLLDNHFERLRQIEMCGCDKPDELSTFDGAHTQSCPRAPKAT